jgi:hypothetical protein
MGRSGEGMSLIDETIRFVEVDGDFVFLPELLRVKGNALLSLPVVVGGRATLFQRFARMQPSSGRTGLGVADCNRHGKIPDRTETG